MLKSIRYPRERNTSFFGLSNTDVEGSKITKSFRTIRRTRRVRQNTLTNKKLADRQIENHKWRQRTKYQQNNLRRLRNDTNYHQQVPHRRMGITPQEFEDIKEFQDDRLIDSARGGAQSVFYLDENLNFDYNQRCGSQTSIDNEGNNNSVFLTVPETRRSSVNDENPTFFIGSRPTSYKTSTVGCLVPEFFEGGVLAPRK